LRQIGTLPDTADPRVFGDYLLSLGVTSRAVRSPEGWAIWVHNEDLLPRAREEFAAYRENPDDPRFRASAKVAEEVRRESVRLDKQYRKNVRDMTHTWDRLQFRRRPLTIALVVICVAIYLAGNLVPGLNEWLWDRLGFFSLSVLANRSEMARGLDDITRRGEVWRLLTPAFLHVNLLHLVFNMWATLIEGTVIEVRRGTKTLLVLVLVSAVVSNIGQYIYVINFYTVLRGWGGISGVGYALFGYLWMKGRFEPEQGMILHPSSVRTMLIWLLLGFTGFLPMANGAHVMGLVVGVLFGLARF
jgi:GlpG protein